MKKLKLAVIVIAASILLSNSVYFESLSEHKRAAALKTFDPEAFVVHFGQELPKEFDRAVGASTLLDLLAGDMKTASVKYGRTLGVSSRHSFLLKGRGRIVDIQDELLLVRLDGSGGQTIAIQTDFIFGNQVRDASGLVHVGDFPSTMDFNAISSEINKTVVTQLLPPILGRIKAGNPVHFVAATTVDEEAQNMTPLKVVPAELENLE